MPPDKLLVEKNARGPASLEQRLHNLKKLEGNKLQRE